MIEISNLSMAYATEDELLQVLADVNVTIRRGDTVAITGPSGSGKTTLLSLLAGLELPHSGDIRMLDKSLVNMNADQLADLRRDQLGIIFQSFHLIPSLTALNNVALSLQIAGKSGATERAELMLEKVGLADRCHHYPSQLSGGEQQRVAIARALIHSPKLVLADEPTGNLDQKTGEKIIELLFALNQESASTLLVVTHDEAIARRCQRILRLWNSKLVEDDAHVVSA